MSFATRLAACALVVSSVACSVWRPLVPTPGPAPAAIKSVTVPQLSWLGAGGTVIRVGALSVSSHRPRKRV